MDWRPAMRATWRSTLNIGGCLTVLFLATFVLIGVGAFLRLLAGLGPVIVETIGRDRISRIWHETSSCVAFYTPYVASFFGACAILYLVRRINRRDDPEYAALPDHEDESDADWSYLRQFRAPGRKCDRDAKGTTISAAIPLTGG
jgi:hypothetical protein